ncbi:MAG TPA: aminodeoxychorismate/anthranilate synthase component II [Candidatus Omnitrophota bacterium]|nr:aminodeoxychorismate/anthranilate synthase component II [Candidatus Omnitrophota bacterium]
MMIMIDNYDSFTYNLVQYFGELGVAPKVFRNDEVTVRQIQKLKPSLIVISPGPCTPKEAGVSNDVIRAFAGKVPILGVCLGHQCLGDVFGGKIVRAKRIMHGKVSDVYHDRDPLFAGVNNPFPATRYHSLVIEPKSFPADLKKIGWTKDGEIMAVRHKTYPIWGVQFHPESILTTQGMTLLSNFLKLAKRKANKK